MYTVFQHTTTLLIFGHSWCRGRTISKFFQRHIPKKTLYVGLTVGSFLWIFQWKNCENRSRYAQVMTRNQGVVFHWNTVYIASYRNASSRGIECWQMTKSKQRNWWIVITIVHYIYLVGLLYFTEKWINHKMLLISRNYNKIAMLRCTVISLFCHCELPIHLILFLQHSSVL